MSKTTISNFSINGFAMDFSEDSKRKARACHYCQKLTTGRATYSKVNGGKARPVAACMDCAMKAAVEAAFKPIKEATCRS